MVDKSGAKWTAPHLEQFCDYGIEKVMFALAETLYEQGVDPEQRRLVKEAMNTKLMRVAEMMIVVALERKMIDVEYLRQSHLMGKKKKTRSVIIEED